MMDAKHAMIGRAAASVFALLFACAAGGKLIDLPERGVENPPSIVASNIPEYKVDAHCRNVASFGGPFSETTYNSCFKMEQSSYDSIKPIWSGLPPNIRDHCNGVATFGGEGSYSTLSTCINMELSAARANRSRQFQK
jgi:hypothetical protein